MRGILCMCAAVLGAVAATNERGLIINRIFEFGSDDATIFIGCYACAALLSW